MMASSLLYKLCQHKVSPGVKVNEKLFKHVHTTKHGLMRVYQVMNVSQESKDWVADPKNRICDAPGSWYCVGPYPPALEKLIAKRRNFAQIEDFNKQGGKSAYTKLIEKELFPLGPHPLHIQLLRIDPKPQNLSSFFRQVGWAPKTFQED
eukprot:g26111.t1